MQRPDSRIYVGRLEAGVAAVYVVGAASVEQLHPAGEPLRWGADAGDAAAALARALLTDAIGSEPSADACRRFSQQILSRLPDDGFALQRETVDAWLRRAVGVER